MKFKQYIDESYYQTFKIDNEVIEIFKNPNTSDFKGSPEVKCIMDSKGNLFSWARIDPAFHHQVLKSLKFSTNKIIPFYIFKRSGRIVVEVAASMFDKCTSYNYENKKDQKEIIKRLETNRNLQKLLPKYEVKY